MCKWCYCPDTDLAIPRILSKFDPERALCEPFVCKRGERLIQAIREKSACKDVYEERAVFDLILAHATPAACPITEKDPSTPITPLLVGVNKSFLEFEEALKFLAHYCPTRMHAIEQLEINLHKTVSTIRQQRTSAVTSLQTRQALEMDMLTNHPGAAGQHSELESMVSQHVAEMDSVVAHWDAEVKAVESQQLREYKDLVMEVFESVKSDNLAHDNPVGVGGALDYRRPVIEGGEFLSMRPVAARPDRSRKTRLVRISALRADILTDVISPSTPVTHDTLDPEEKAHIRSSPGDQEMVSAVILGWSDGLLFKSNQDIELSRTLDSKCSTDCRWPSFGSQLEYIQERACDESRFFVTRHSNLRYRIGSIFHIRPHMGELRQIVKDILNWCDSLGIERVFVPRVIVEDLRAPRTSSCDHDITLTEPLVEECLRELSNSAIDSSLKESAMMGDVSDVFSGAIRLLLGDSSEETSLVDPEDLPVDAFTMTEIPKRVFVAFGEPILKYTGTSTGKSEQVQLTRTVHCPSLELAGAIAGIDGNFAEFFTLIPPGPFGRIVFDMCQDRHVQLRAEAGPEGSHMGDMTVMSSDGSTNTIYQRGFSAFHMQEPPIFRWDKGLVSDRVPCWLHASLSCFVWSENGLQNLVQLIGAGSDPKRSENDVLISIELRSQDCDVSVEELWEFVKEYTKALCMLILTPEETIAIAKILGIETKLVAKDVLDESEDLWCTLVEDLRVRVGCTTLVTVFANDESNRLIAGHAVGATFASPVNFSSRTGLLGRLIDSLMHVNSFTDTEHFEAVMGDLCESRMHTDSVPLEPRALSILKDNLLNQVMLEMADE